MGYTRHGRRPGTFCWLKAAPIALNDSTCDNGRRGCVSGVVDREAAAAATPEPLRWTVGVDVAVPGLVLLLLLCSLGALAAALEGAHVHRQPDHQAEHWLVRERGNEQGRR